MKNLLKKASVDKYLDADQRLERTLTAKDLLFLGVGAVIGTGIFILPGHEAAAHAGPAVSIAFLVAALLSGIVGMAYAEFSSAMPIAGSGYTYGSVIYGELVGWILGWCLIIEYMLAVSAEATGFAAYFNNNILTSLGVHLPASLTNGPLQGGGVNLTAIIIMLIIGAILLGGAKISTRVENNLVILKISIILLFIVVGAFFIKPSNYVPFYPKEFQSGLWGLGGISTATATVFFAFLGFDGLAANSAETKDPQKNVAKGIIGTVIVSTVLYVVFSLVLVGMVNYKLLGVDDPAAFAFKVLHSIMWNKLITIGALIGIFTALLSTTLATSRIIYAFGRDHLIFPALGKVDQKSKLPINSLVTTVIIATVLAGFVPLDNLLQLVNAGTLVAFVLIPLGIIPLRRRKDIVNEGFKMPGYPVLPILAALASLYYLLVLPNETKILTSIWIIIGILVYIFYGSKHSKITNGK
ncbi:MAG: amino acid permease [Lactobacillus sp.]|nr:amino acid permease [Lactobacillus sp.]